MEGSLPGLERRNSPPSSAVCPFFPSPPPSLPGTTLPPGLRPLKKGLTALRTQKDVTQAQTVPGCRGADSGDRAFGSYNLVGLEWKRCLRPASGFEQGHLEPTTRLAPARPLTSCGHGGVTSFLWACALGHLRGSLSPRKGFLRRVGQEEDPERPSGATSAGSRVGGTRGPARVCPPTTPLALAGHAEPQGLPHRRLAGRACCPQPSSLLCLCSLGSRVTRPW